MAGLFTPPPSADEERRQSIFRKLKPLTVPVLGHVPLRASSPRVLAKLLQALLAHLHSFTAEDRAVVTPALASYAVFPISQLLESTPLAKIPDDVLAPALGVLAAVVRMWRECSAGMEDARWLEILGIGALAIGGPLQKTADVKVKGKEKAPSLRDEAVLRGGVELLGALLRPTTSKRDVVEEEDVIGSLEDLDLDDKPRTTNRRSDPSRATPPCPPTKAIPILFHALTALLDISSPSEKQIASLHASALRCTLLVVHCMAAHDLSSATPASDSASPPDSGTLLSSAKGRDLVASALPGCVSAICKVTVSSSAKSDEILAALELLEVVVGLSVGEEWPEIGALLKMLGEGDTGDADANGDGEGQRRVEELVENWKQSTGPAPSPSDLASPMPSTSTALQSQSAHPQTFSRTTAWLRRTIHHLSLSLRLLSSPLSAHHHPSVRVGWTRLCIFLLRRCPVVLSLSVQLDDDRPAAGEEPREAEGLQVVVEALLRSCADEWLDVSGPAKGAFEALNSRAAGRRKAVQKVWEALYRHLAGLARLITRRDDERVRLSAGLIASAIDVISGLGTSANVLLPSSVTPHGIERWSGPLLVALELELPRLRNERRGASDPDHASRSAFKGIGAGSNVLLLEAGSVFVSADTQRQPFSPLRFKNLGDPPAVRALEQMLIHLGNVGEVRGWPDRSALVGHFLNIAERQDIEPRGLTALLIVVLSVEGAMGRSDRDGGARKKAIRKLARRIVRSLIELEEAVDGAQEDEMPDMAREDRQDLVRFEGDATLEVSHVKGNTALASEVFTSLKPTSATPLEDARVRREARRALRSALVLRGFAACASVLEDAFRPLLFDVLYPILSHLSSAEPFVAEHARVALTRIAFDAGYAAPTNLLLDNVDYVVDAISRRLKLPDLDPQAPRVLAAMIQVAGGEIVPFVQDVVEECFDALDDFHGYDALCASLLAVFDALLQAAGQDLDLKPRPKPSRFRKRKPDPEAEWTKLDRWLKHRKEDDVEPGVDDFPLDYWNPSYIGVTREEEPTAGADDPDDPPPPTRTQVVCAGILSKSLYFLSHPSAFLRARVLALVASGVPILSARSSHGNRESELLPLIHRAWPFVLNRLGQETEEPYVCAEACRLVEVLAGFAGDFMGRRVTEDVWPRFKTLLRRRAEAEERKAALRRWGHTTSHRLALSILRTMTTVAKDVDLREEFAWDVAEILLGFLKASEHEDLQSAARELYVALAEENGDSIWLCLMAASGQIERMAYMQVPGVEANAELVLKEI